MKRENFKSYLLFIVLSLILILNLNFVSAQDNFGGGDIVDYVYSQLTPAFASIFAPIFYVDTVDEFLFVKILLFILFFSVIFMSLSQVKIFRGNKPIRVIVSLIVALLSSRYLNIEDNNFLRALLLPYGALGGAIAIILPMLIYFFFVHSSIPGGFGRRFAWFMYGVIFIFLWLSQEYANIGGANWIYIVGIIFVLLNLFFDKSIHSYFELGKWSKVQRTMLTERIATVQAAYLDAIKTGDEDIAEELKERVKRLRKKL